MLYRFNAYNSSITSWRHSENIRLDFRSNPHNLDQNLTFWISFWKEATDLIFKIIGTDNLPIYFVWQNKSLYKKEIIHLHFVTSRMKVSNYDVDSDD